MGQRNEDAAAPATSTPACPPSRLSEWNTGKLDKQEKETLALATEELKDMLQYGHLELADKTMDPGYIQHNPRCRKAATDSRNS